MSCQERVGKQKCEILYMTEKEMALPYPGPTGVWGRGWLCVLVKYEVFSLVQPRCPAVFHSQIMKRLYRAGIALHLLGDSTVILTPGKLQPNSSDLGTSLAHHFPN